MSCFGLELVLALVVSELVLVFCFGWELELVLVLVHWWYTGASAVQH